MKFDKEKFSELWDKEAEKVCKEKGINYTEKFGTLELQDKEYYVFEINILELQKEIMENTIQKYIEEENV